MNKKDWHVLEFYMPISESVNVGKDFTIRGTAINETTTRNGITYIAEELEKAAPTFKNKPILLDHDNSIKSIVGRTTEKVVYNSNSRAIEFEAKIMDEKIKEMIKDGRITNVSIGVRIEDLKQNDDEGTLTAIGMEGLELSLVAIPGDPGANIANAMCESFKVKKDYELNYEKGGIKEMAEDEQKTQETPTEEAEDKEEAKEEGTDEEVAEEKLQKTVINNSIDMSAFTEMVKSLKEEIKELKKEMADEKEKDSENPSAEDAPKDETKGEVKTDAEEDEDKEVDEGMHYEKADTGKGFQLWRDYTSEDCKFKRLLR